MSVVIPTIDAGPSFERVLASVRFQKGIADPEIVVVDSGSSDGTPELATAAGARVVYVDPQAFGHGRTRNRGVETSSGKVVLMLAQDALLLGRDAIRALLAELESDPRLAAVSARQVPRSDSDLYAAFSVFSHERVVQASAGGSSPDARRAAATMDDVCVAIRRKAWSQLRYEDVAFAEDLDFGLRAVAAGWRLSVARNAAVAHSHTRSVGYVLRRSVVERLHVGELFDDRRYARASAEDPAVVLAGSGVLVQQVAAAADGLADAAPLRVSMQGTRRRLAARAGRGLPVAELDELARILDAASTDPRAERCSRLLRDDLLALLGWPPLLDFADQFDCVDAATALTFIAKLTASAVGRAFADSVRRTPGAAAPAWLVEGV